MYPIGFLFGLGFDTATEVGLLGISATQAARGLSFATILVFPALFTAGMSLMDTTDSVLMTGAYGWAFVRPIRKLWYNLTITAASVVVALFIGGVEALGLIGDQAPLEGGIVARNRRAEQQSRQFRLRRRRHLRRRVARLCDDVSAQGLRPNPGGAELITVEQPLFRLDTLAAQALDLDHLALAPETRSLRGRAQELADLRTFDFLRFAASLANQQDAVVGMPRMLAGSISVMAFDLDRQPVLDQKIECPVDRRWRDRRLSCRRHLIGVA